MTITEKQMTEIKNLLMEMKETAKKIGQIDIDRRYYQGYSTAAEDVCDVILNKIFHTEVTDNSQRI